MYTLAITHLWEMDVCSRTMSGKLARYFGGVGWDEESTQSFQNNLQISKNLNPKNQIVYMLEATEEYFLKYSTENIKV